MIMVASQKECIYEAAAASSTGGDAASPYQHQHKLIKSSATIMEAEQDSIRTTSWSSNTTTCVDHDAATTSSSSSWLQLRLGLDTDNHTSPPLDHHIHLDLNLNLIGAAGNESIRNSAAAATITSTSGVYNPSRNSTNHITSAGLWFTLLPHKSLLQPSLPPLSTKYLRIKDERMKVGMVIKYVAHKLGLPSTNKCKSQVEIRCRGQVLKPDLRLQHVRDEIWSERQDALTLLPNSSTSPHLMILHYSLSSYQPSSS